nr:hypothetical protein [Maliibacterium massiliense]
MREFFLLIRAGVKNALGAGQATRKSGNKRGSAMLFFTALAILILGAYITLYYALLAQSLAPIGQLPMLLVMCAFTASALSLVLTLLRAQGMLFSFKDYDLLLSMPVPRFSIVLSKIAMMTLYIYAVNLLFLLPGCIIYGIYAGADLGFYLLLIPLFFLLPLPSIALGCLFAYIVSAVAAHMRYKNAVMIVGFFAFFIGLMALSFNMPNVLEGLLRNGASLAAAVGGVYPPAQWFAQAALGGGLPFLYLALAALLPFALFVLLLAKTFQHIQSRLSAVRTRHNFKLSAQRAGSPLAALTRRELRSFLSTPIYVFNTAFGGVLVLAAAIACLFFDAQAIATMFEIPGAAGMMPAVVLLVVCFCIAVSSTCTCAISLEGKSLWIAKSLPVRTRTLFLSKVMLNLLVMVPTLVVGGVLFNIAFPMSAVARVCIFVIPLALCWFISVAGLYINLLFPRFNWTNPTVVVKQSASVVVAMLLGFALIALLVAGYTLLPLAADTYYLLAAGVLVALGIAAWALLNAHGAKLWRAL